MLQQEEVLGYMSASGTTSCPKQVKDESGNFQAYRSYETGASSEWEAFGNFFFWD